MARRSINRNLDSLFDNFWFGDFQIYSDKRQEAKARKLLNGFEGTQSILKVAYDMGSQKFGEKILKIVKRCLKNGTPPKGVSWSPHSIATVKALGEHTLLNWTHQYLKSVGIYKNKNKRNPYTYVGLPQRVRKARKRGDSRKTLSQVAALLERGSGDGHLPPRPLWAPAYKEAGSDRAFVETITREIQKEIRKYL